MSRVNLHVRGIVGTLISNKRNWLIFMVVKVVKGRYTIYLVQLMNFNIHFINHYSFNHHNTGIEKHLLEEGFLKTKPFLFFITLTLVLDSKNQESIANFIFAQNAFQLF